MNTYMHFVSKIYIYIHVYYNYIHTCLFIDYKSQPHEQCTYMYIYMYYNRINKKYVVPHHYS